MGASRTCPDSSAQSAATRLGRHASMKVGRFLIELSALCLKSQVCVANQNQNEFLAGFVAGRYHLIGKSPDSDNTYYGKVGLISTERGIEVHRFVAGKTIVGSGAIEKATADDVNVLRIRFKENNTEYEETCMIDGDLDNFARISCYLYRSGVKTGNPGLEALFIDRGER